LIEETKQRNNEVLKKHFSYDKRGNIKEIVEGEKRTEFTFGAINRLEEARVGDSRKLYKYHGTGARIGEVVESPTERLESAFTVDITKLHSNLLSESVNGTNTDYLWDSALLGMTGDRATSFVIDELGTPIELLSEDGITGAYAYDEFGVERRITRYSECGTPFTFTGYRKDTFTGTYFAQAREYLPEAGRFGGRDIVKGNIVYPITQNEYGYCYSDPENYVDKDGNLPTILIGAAAGGAIGGLGSIASDMIQGRKIDWKKAGKNTLKGAAIGGLAGAGVNPKVASIAVNTVEGAVVGAVSNRLTGGSLINGAIGGAVNGLITGALSGDKLLQNSYANFVGGFVGNTVTELLNNKDIKDKKKRKSFKAILATSAFVGGAQGILGGSLTTLGLKAIPGDGLYENIAKAVWSHGFLQFLGFGSGVPAYVLSDAICKNNMKYNCID
jgi:RHS repeat-associated protein